MSALRAEQAINLLSGLDSSLFPLWLQILYPFVQSKIILLKFLKVVALNFSFIFLIKGVCQRVDEYIIYRGKNLQIVDSVLKQVSLQIIWQRNISPFVVLQIAIPTQLEQYSIMLIICSFMFCFLPVVFIPLFYIDLFVCIFQDQPLYSVKRQFTLRLFIERPVLGTREIEEGYLEFNGVLLIVFLLVSKGGVLLLLIYLSFDFYYCIGFKLFLIGLNCLNYSSSQTQPQSYQDYSSSLFYMPYVELVLTREVERWTWFLPRLREGLSRLKRTDLLVLFSSSQMFDLSPQFEYFGSIYIFLLLNRLDDSQELAVW